ncbi:MAG TPA: efflux RND transporter periplasmic adaptor subunit [Xanthobacteraceae bacterium]|nr:efflux RND transporter periplasmic adaptor subunit [Xanthobacteraceae bacterium]
MKAFCLPAMLAAILGLAACGGTNERVFQGWVEADLIFVSPYEMGRIETLSVREGDTVAAGAALFALDADLQQADVAVQQAAVINAQHDYERAKALRESATGTQKALDDAIAALRSAEARLASAQARLVRRQVFSPVSGTVQQIYFRPGETVPAGRPVLALLPPGNIKLRFFVPEPVLPKVALGQPVQVDCDGCPKDLTARVSFISRSSEFTPPVIYSLEERNKLVYLIEARTEKTENLRVGQPVTVTLGGKL